MNRYVRLPMLLLWLTTLWIALWGDLSLGNVVGGFAVAVGVLMVARPTGVSGLERYHFRPVAAVQYGLYFLALLVVSNLMVAWEIVTPKTHLTRAIIRVPMHSRSAGVVTLIANSITLTPGTITVDVAERDDDGTVRRDLFIHILQLGDIPSVKRDMLKLERLAIKAFGESDDLAAVEATLAALGDEREMSG
ncbi:MAG: Na+/H+ antiporter subunit E [Ilumatobacter sp.]|nr:Na+/H+ antiporter subunit E [Ilumatobacter sp.]